MARIFTTGSADGLGLLRLQTLPINRWLQAERGIGVEATFETLHHYTLVKSAVLNLEEGSIGDFHAHPPNAFV
jgi:hypothetical protein